MAARNPGIVYCSTSGYGQDGPRSAWAGHDLDYLAVSGYLAMSAPCQRAGPRRFPGRRSPMQRPAACTRRSRSWRRSSRGSRPAKGTYLDVAVADGALWLMSLAVDEHLATGSSPRPGHDVLSGRYACYGNYQAADGRFIAVGAIEPKFFANLCSALGCAKWIEHQYDDGVQDEIRADLAAAFARRDRDSLGRVSSAGADTCVAPVLEPAEVAGDAQYRHSRCFVEAEHPTAGRFMQVGAGASQVCEAVSRSRSLLPDPKRPRPSSCSERRASGRECRGHAEAGECWRDRRHRASVPQDLIDLCGKVQYEEISEIPVEHGYIWTSCASVENANPIFWDDAAAEAITGGPIAPPSMVSVWFRPHHWAPGRTHQLLAAAGPLRPEGAPRPPRSRHDRRHDRVSRAGQGR